MARKSGGIKGFFERAGKSFTQGFEFSKEWSWWLAQKGGTLGLFLASTSMVVLMPLIFEINREAMVRTMDNYDG
jgi:hypothetical protein